MAKPRPPPQRKRGKTPYDDKMLLPIWRSLEAEFLEQGYSEREAHEKIAAMPQYNTSRTTVFRWLKYGQGTVPTQKARSYAERVKIPNYRAKANFAQRFAFEPSRYVAPLFRAEDEAVTLDQLTARLSKEYDYSPRRPTLHRLAKPHPRTGEILLVPVGDTTDPMTYRLAKGVYRRFVRDPRR